MTLVDVLVLLVILLAAMVGYRSGILSQALGLAGAAAGVGLVILLGPWIGPALDQYDQPLRALLALGGASALVVTGDAIGSTLGGILHERAAASFAAPAERLGGALFGICQGIVICWLVGGLIATGPFPSLAGQAQRSVALQTILGSLPAPTEVLGQLGGILGRSGLPDVFVGLEPVPAAPVEVPDNAEADRIGRLGAPSTVRLESAACGHLLVGTGFVVRTGFVVTNAHVVAGTDTTTVTADIGGRQVVGHVVEFDPQVDLAILYVPRLDLPPLTFAASDPGRGTLGVALGHPGGDPLTFVPAAVTASIDARGRDLYGTAIVTRQVLELQAAVRPGDSGGPLVLSDGTVGGVVFADSRSDPAVGYALAPSSVRDDVAAGLGRTTTVDTGPCVS